MSKVKINDYQRTLLKFENRNYNYFEEENLSNLSRAGNYMKNNASGRAGLHLFTPFKKSDIMHKVLQTSKKNIPAFNSNKDSKSYLEKRHLETVQKITEMRVQKNSSSNKKTSLTKKIRKPSNSKNSNSNKKIEYTPLKSKLKNIQHKVSSPNSFTEFKSNFTLKSTTRSDNHPMSNFHSEKKSSAIDQKIYSSTDHMTRNIQTTNLSKTQEITPITIKNTSSSFINKSAFKRLKELEEFKQYLSTFQGSGINFHRTSV